jgi:hypothetical protein
VKRVRIPVNAVPAREKQSIAGNRATEHSRRRAARIVRDSAGS